ncbi:MAG: tripartite tricarboxylate transporter substrate-binding protein [Hyphomicrobiales bacterium]|nr:tripartite tricarboxylate transporter substrate-binding protein [Hyphomicrobiales bacterium]
MGFLNRFTRRSAGLLAALWLGGAAAIGMLATTPSASAQEVYAGETLTLVVPFPAGGTFDGLARIVAQNLPRFIPGEPTIIVNNQPGGGGIIGTRAVFNAKSDGLTLIHRPSMGILQGALNQAEGVDYAKFDWLGAVAGASYVVIVRSDLVDKGVEALAADRTPIKLGVNAPGGLIYETTKMLAKMGALNVQIVAGYQGGNPIFLAIRQGEIDGLVGSSEILLAQSLMNEMYRGGSIKMLMNFGGSPAPAELRETVAALPKLRDSLTDPVDIAAIDAVNGVIEISRVFAAAPNTPPERLAALRKAFSALLEDPQFIDEVTKAGFQPAPVGPEQTEAIVKSVAELPDNVKERLKALLE